MPSILSQMGGLGGVPLGKVPTDSVGVNASKPRTFVPPTGVNTGTPGRPPSTQGGAANGGAAGAGTGTVAAPPQIAQLTSPVNLLQGVGGAGAGAGAGAGGSLAPGVLPIAPQPGQLTFDPLTGVWTLPDGTTQPGSGS